MPRWKWVIAVSVVLLLAVGSYVLFFADRTTPVDVDRAVEDFRTQGPATTSPGPSPTAPVTDGDDGDDGVAADDAEAAAGDEEIDCPTDESPPVTDGVYVYDTEGGEELGVPGSPSHDYGGESVMTVVGFPGGFRTRWQPVEERIQESVLCLDGEGGYHMRRSYDARRFFGVTTSRTLDCDPGSVQLPPPGVERGEGRCSGAGTTMTWTTTVIDDAEELIVGGTPVDAVHVRIVRELTGNTQGTVEEDVWYDRERLLEIRRESVVDAEGDTPLGSAAYDETVTMQLTDLAPQR